jgi:hypothetical protein
MPCALAEKILKKSNNSVSTFFINKVLVVLEFKYSKRRKPTCKKQQGLLEIVSKKQFYSLHSSTLCSGNVIYCSEGGGALSNR